MEAAAAVGMGSGVHSQHSMGAECPCHCLGMHDNQHFVCTCVSCSPDECVEISTILPFWHLTKGVLERLADRRA